MANINNELLLKKFRESGKNYGELAHDTCVSRRTLYNILYAQTKPSYFALVSLAEELDLSDDDIIAIFFPNITLKRKGDFI